MPSENERGEERLSEELDISHVSKVVHAMNMAGSKLTAYPDGHPFVVAAFRKVEDLLQDLFQVRKQLTLGIAKNSVMLGSAVLDQKNFVFQRFAQTLFEQGVVGLTLLRGLTSAELIDFNRIMAQKRNEVARQGGLQALFAKANITHIKAQLIDYGLFHTQDGLHESTEGARGLQSSSFWEEFVNGFFEGALAPDGRSDETPGRGDPESLGLMLNERYLGEKAGTLERLDHVLVTNMKHGASRPFGGFGDSSERMVKFVQSLNPDLRQRFVERFLKALPDSDEVAGDLLSGLSEEIILDALEEYTRDELYIPPNIVKIMQRLSGTAQESDRAAADELLSTHSKDELAEKLKAIFKEDDDDRFVPLDYQKALRDVVAADELSASEFSEVQQLGLTLTEQSINMSLALILGDVIIACGDAEIAGSVKQRLRDCCVSIVRKGDFQQVLNIIEMIDGNTARSQEGDTVPRRRAARILSDGSFTDEALTALAHWGREKQFYATKLIRLIGAPFIEPLLDRLAEEESKETRLFYLSSLKEFGLTARDPVLRRLRDGRWYYVRNLLQILRNLNDPFVLDTIHDAFSHSHPQVRTELLQILVTFKDPRAAGILLKEMDSVDHERCMKAITLAGKTQDKAIVHKLTGFLRKKGLSRTDLEIKKAAIDALAEVGDASVLPVFMKILGGFVLFFRGRSQELKIAIVESLGQYAASDALPLLSNIAKSRSRLLASQAAETMRTFEEGNP